MGFFYRCYYNSGDKIKTLDKLKAKKKQMQEQMQRGRVVTEQMRSERQRKRIQKKIQNSKLAEPGTIKYGLAYKQNPLDFMHDAYEIRKQKREERRSKR